VEVSTASSYRLPVGSSTYTYVAAGGTYTVAVTDAHGCRVESAPFEVKVEELPEAPVIKGPQLVKENGTYTYGIETVNSGMDYRWIIPNAEGYSLESNSLTDTTITLKIGSASTVLRVQAKMRNSNGACSAGVEGRLGITVTPAYKVDVYPTVISSGSQIKVVPKNMEITSIALVSSVGESYALTFMGVSFPITNGNEVLLELPNTLSTGHYFVICYGRGPDGKRAVHTEHIVVR
jgi:hypothetical protein